ncbi:MAG: hypothetical protein QXY49_01720 [Thermofilaceae archaeon]
MRHLESLAIAMITTLALTYFTAIVVKQITPVHQVSVQRALAWVLLCSQDTATAVNLTITTLGDHLVELWVNEVSLSSSNTIQKSICYAFAIFDVSTNNVDVLRACVKP